MRHDGQSPMPMMPYGMMMPYPYGMPQREVPRREEDAPIRVKVAFAFLRELARKTDQVIVQTMGSDVSSGDAIRFAGNPLVPEEEATRDSALALLAQYFDGKMKLSDLEQKEQADRDKAKGDQKNQLGVVIACPPCNGQSGNNDCGLCRGSGLFACQPVQPGGKPRK